MSSSDFPTEPAPPFEMPPLTLGDIMAELKRLNANVMSALNQIQVYGERAALLEKRVAALERTAHTHD